MRVINQREPPAVSLLMNSCGSFPAITQRTNQDQSTFGSKDSSHIITSREIGGIVFLPSGGGRPWFSFGVNTIGDFCHPGQSPYTSYTQPLCIAAVARAQLPQIDFSSTPPLS